MEKNIRMTSPDRPIYFWAVFSFFSAIVLSMVWTNKYLPMVDLPQFSTQAFILKNFHSPTFEYPKLYSINWFSPYIFPAFIAWAFSSVVPVFIATKLVVTLALLGLPLSLYFLLQRTNGDPWWALFGFVLCFGYSFQFGFVTYITAIPLGLLFLALSWDQEILKRKSVIAGLSLLAILIYFSHLLVFAFVVSVFLLRMLLSIKERKVRNTILMVFLTLFGIATCWFLFSLRKNYMNSDLFFWDLSLDRIYNFPCYLGSCSKDRPGFFLGLFLIGIFFSSRPTFKRDIPSWSIFAVAAILCFMGPHSLTWASYLYQRFAIFVCIGLLVVCERPLNKPWIWSIRRAMIVLCLAWFSMCAYRWGNYNNEGKIFDKALEKMTANQSLFWVAFGEKQDTEQWESYRHFPAWYQTFKGGVLPNNFEIYPNWVIQPAPGKDLSFTKRAKEVEFNPESFDGCRDNQTTYLILRARDKNDRAVFDRKCPENFQKIFSEEKWTLYQVANHKIK